MARLRTNRPVLRCHTSTAVILWVSTWNSTNEYRVWNQFKVSSINPPSFTKPLTFDYVATPGDQFSTPPNSPPPRTGSSSSSTAPPDKQSVSSYEKAVVHNSVWKDDAKMHHQAMPQHVSSPVKYQPPLPTLPPPSNLLPDYPNVEIVTSSPAAIRVGFFDARVEATNSSELPGSSQPGGGWGERGEVITTPPLGSTTSKKPAARSSQDRRSSSPRAVSIEEADRERGRAYAPLLDISDKRRASATPSQFSMISVSPYRLSS